MAVRIVTDSTCDLPAALVEAHGIRVVPLTVFFGAEALRDGIDVTPEEFYDKLKASSALPKTSQPSASLFEEAYREAAKDGDEIVFRARAEAPGAVSIGFGECRGVLNPAIAWPA